MKIWLASCPKKCIKRHLGDCPLNYRVIPRWGDGLASESARNEALEYEIYHLLSSPFPNDLLRYSPRKSGGGNHKVNDDSQKAFRQNCSMKSFEDLQLSF